MTIGILTEKPSAARNFAKALGGMRGTYNGEDYVIVHARGHLYEFKDPSQMVAADLTEKYRKWDVPNLPWDPGQMDWALTPIKDTGPLRKDIQDALRSCDTIAIGTDLDPTGEGGMIAVNAFTELGLRPKTWARMYFTDEAPASLQKAFTERKTIPDLATFDEYRKARFRSQFDLLSMQFTRIATAQARALGQNTVLRQGRLKSAMVKLVGDQLKAHKDYVKKPFFQNRFRDEHGVVYTDPDEQRYDSKTQVPQQYQASAVVKDGQTLKHTAPPRLLDLATLSALLVSKGVKAATVLSTYQKMYEAQIVSYPRTDDKTITPEQFNEMLPLVDKIAGVVGVDAGRLSHRSARKTHVKPEGAHGANRPGLKVPASLDDLERDYGKAGRLIYETLAKNFLAMLAEDYAYEQHKGHVADHPTFVGRVNVPVSPGWKAVFDPDADKDDDPDSQPGDEETTNTTGLGTRAEPFVHEGANTRPEHPSMRWLMKQLEKRDVGTGATRTSTYADVTSTKDPYQLLVEKGKKLTLATAGEMSWHLLPGTRIGDLSVTEKVYADMRAIAEGTTDAEQCLTVVAEWVREDIVTMTKNREAMRTALGLTEQVVVDKELAEGVWSTTGQPVRFTRVWSGHRFTDEEVARLLDSQTINIIATAAGTGKKFEVFGALGESEFKGKTFIGFQRKGFGQADADGNAQVPADWCQHTFTPAEIAKLAAGEGVEANDFVSAKGNRFQTTVYFREEKPGQGKRIVPDFTTAPNTPPASWCKVTFTGDQREALGRGESIYVEGFTSKGGKKFNATVSWTEEKPGAGKRVVPSFG